MAKVVVVVDRGIKWIAYGMLALTVLVVLIALFSKDTEHEAGIGSFDSKSFDTGWVLEREYGRKEEITLPTVIAAEKGETLLIRNVLPHDLTDGSSLLARTAMEKCVHWRSFKGAVYLGGKYWNGILPAKCLCGNGAFQRGCRKRNPDQGRCEKPRSAE